MTSRYLLVVLFALAVAAPLAAHDELRFVGTVVRMDARANVLSMRTKDDGKDVTLAIPFTKETKVERDGKPVASSELRPNTYIVADTLQDHDGHLEAVRIRIVPAPAGAK